MTTTTLSLGYRTSAHKIKSKVSSLHVTSRMNWKPVYFLAILFSSIALFFYIFMVNQLIQGAYVIKNYNKQADALLAENKNLSASFAESGFLGSVQDKATGLNFQKTAGVTYIKILQNSIDLSLNKVSYEN